ncbi:MAG: 4-(cytidine 5'-diphospho)-2-C-methyl-D-erythritol kinase [Clostridia bacterium]|nr:4-(cytidine 5'-diphospho)-2-C-methyl-D-erythritol kinase [Clostridia bacterium]
MKLYNDIIIKGSRAISKSYAKINLTLDVLGRLENGYHEVKMIMQSLNLFDLVIVDKQDFGINISTNCKFLPNNDGNIAYKAAELFFKETGIAGGAKILIHKNIPVAAGLAGGSGNAAATLCSLNLLYNAELSDSELERLALKLGADVPYCLSGGTQLAEGIGERLTPLKPICGAPVVLVKPPVSILTADIYRMIDSAPTLVHPNTDTMLHAIESSDTDRICSNISNILESVTQELCPKVISIKEKMLALGALGTAMSGSGPTVFGIFPDNATAKKACDSFSEKYDEVFLTHTIA